MKVCDNMEKANNLSSLRVICRYYPLDTEDLMKFYIDTTEARGINMLEELSLSFDYIPNVYQQVLYLGHAGSGKSTLLYQLEQKMKTTYRVIRFSIQDLLDINNLTIVDLLYGIYERVLFECKDQVDDEIDLLNRVYNTWYSSFSKEEIVTSEADISLKSEAGMGISAKIFSLFTKLTSTLKIGTSDREKIYSEVSRNITDYIDLLNELILTIKEKIGKPILLMIEDLEKITDTNKANEIFILHGGYFHDINLHMLLTAPIYLKYSLDYKNIISQDFTDAVMCPMIAVTDMNYEPFEIGINVMRKIVLARINSELIDDSALNLVIMYSGGVLRDLFSMLTQASKYSQQNGRNKITDEDIKSSFCRLKEVYQCVIRNEYVELLKKIYENPQGLIGESDKQFFNLMRSDVIIEYNGIQWRGIHPAVIAYLKEHDYI